MRKPRSRMLPIVSLIFFKEKKDYTYIVKISKCKYEYDFIYMHACTLAHTHMTVGIKRNETQETSTGCLRRADL